MPNREISVRFSNETSTQPTSSSNPTEAVQRLRPHTAVGAAGGAVSNSRPSSGAPFLDARGNRTQPSRDQPAAGGHSGNTPTTTMTGLRRKKRKKRRPKTALGIEHQQSAAAATSHINSSSNPNPPPGGSSEPNFPTLNPRVFHALRGFLTPESLKKTKFYSEREERMSTRREQLDEQQERLRQRIGGFYERLDSFIAETNAAAQWEPEDKRKQKSLLDDLENL